MASKNLSGIINVFIIAIVSVSLLIAVAGSINKQTDYQNVENETVDISSVRINGNHINESVELQVEKYPGATNVGDEVLKNFVLYNDTTQSVAATETTDYVVNDSTGILTLKNTSYWTDTSTNTSSADYDYAHDNYIGD